MCGTCTSTVQTWCSVQSVYSRPSHQSVAESNHPSFPPSATQWRCCPHIQHYTQSSVFQLFVLIFSTAKGVQFGTWWMHFVIDLYDPPGIPLKPSLVSFSKLNPCPSNHCHKGTILVHLLAFWVSFLQVVPAKKGICFDRQTATGACAASLIPSAPHINV